MTTSQTDLAAQKLEAEFREAEAKLRVVQAKAEARKAQADMDEISGLAAARERLKKDIADMKVQTANDYRAAKQSAERNLNELQVRIQRVSDRYSAWDEARERRFYARLDEAEARLKVWKSKADQKRVGQTVKLQDDLATLEENIAIARAQAAEARRDKYVEKAVDALNDAEGHFEQAFQAAQRRYGT